MRIALCSDEPYPVDATVQRWLREPVGAWLDTEPGHRGDEGVLRLRELEQRSFGAALAGARDRA